MNPLGTKATSFRVPTKEEMSHDFLWRVHKKTPAHGEVMVFNRSHYEDILVPTVEKIFDKKTIEKRYSQINNFEELLQENGTKILKFYLHVGKDKQYKKLNERLINPTKYWKHNIGDWDTRKSFEEYQSVYESIFEQCNKPERHIIPSDQNRYKINCIAKIILKAFEEMNLKWPKLSPDQETSYLRTKAELESKASEEEKIKHAQILAKHEAKAQAKIEAQQAKKLEKARRKEEKKQSKEAKKLTKLQAKEEKIKAKERAIATKEEAKLSKIHEQEEKIVAKLAEAKTETQAKTTTQPQSTPKAKATTTPRKTRATTARTTRTTTPQ